MEKLYRTKFVSIVNLLLSVCWEPRCVPVQVKYGSLRAALSPPPHPFVLECAKPVSVCVHTLCTSRALMKYFRVMEWGRFGTFSSSFPSPSLPPSLCLSQALSPWRVLLCQAGWNQFLLITHRSLLLSQLNACEGQIAAVLSSPHGYLLWQRHSSPPPPQLLASSSSVSSFWSQTGSAAFSVSSLFLKFLRTWIRRRQNLRVCLKDNIHLTH